MIDNKKLNILKYCMDQQIEIFKSCVKTNPEVQSVMLENISFKKYSVCIDDVTDAAR